jgi:hypothetical protein
MARAHLCAPIISPCNRIGMRLCEVIDFWPDDWAASPLLTAGRTLQTFSPNIEKPSRAAHSRAAAHVHYVGKGHANDDRNCEVL